MMEHRLKKIVIVGGGTAGWMAAAAIAEKFGSNSYTEITLIESQSIGTVGVGEATVPAFREFLKRLKIDEVDFVKRTDASFKLAVAFEGWSDAQPFFFHPFAEHGVSMAGVGFPELWAKLRQAGHDIDIDDYNMGSVLAAMGKFALPQPNPNTGSPMFNYAYHFDAVKVAKYLSSWARTAGVQRIEGRVIEVEQNSETGFVQSLTLESGETVQGDFFIDCSGFRGLLIEQTLETGYEDWSHWLPVNRAVAFGTSVDAEFRPYTLSKALEAGWRWRVPLQSRTGNGYVYCSDFCSDDQAAATLRSELGEDALSEARVLSFVSGMRRQIWNKNVFALGLSSGFLEPLESTSIYLMQAGLFSLLNNFPTKEFRPRLVYEVNRRNRQHWEHIRDFIILHYCQNNRTDQPFWDHMRNMKIPDSLTATISLYRETGKIKKEQTEFFQNSSWISLFSGLGIVPEYYHPAADDLNLDLLANEFRNLNKGLREAAEKAMQHRNFVEANCSAQPSMTV